MYDALKQAGAGTDALDSATKRLVQAQTQAEMPARRN
jgi:hypothetical protein